MSFLGAFTKNVVFKSIGEIFIRLLSFAFIVFVARTIGDEQFGIINFALSFVLLFIVIVDFGLNHLLVRDAAKNLNYIKNIVIHLLLLKIVLVVVFLMAILLGMHLVVSDPVTLQVVLWMALFVVLNSFTEFLNAVFHAHQKMQYEALVMSIQKLGLLILGVGAISVGMGVRGVAIAYAAAGFIGLVSSGVLLLKKRFLFGTWKWNALFLKGLLKQALPLTLTTFFINIYFRIDITLLNNMRSSAEVGWYGAAHKCIEVLMVIPAILVVAAFPGFSILFRENREQLIRMSTKVIKLLLILGAPIAGGAWVVAEPLMVLLFGQDYAPSGAALSWLALALCMIFQNYALSFLLISCKRQTVNAIASGMAVIVSVAMNLLLIPQLGHVGAAISAVVTEVFLFITYLTAVRRLLFPVPIFKIVLKVIFSIGLMLSVVVWMQHLPVFWVILTAAVVYGAALLVSRTIDKEDLVLLGKILKRRL